MITPETSDKAKAKARAKARADRAARADKVHREEIAKMCAEIPTPELVQWVRELGAKDHGPATRYASATMAVAAAVIIEREGTINALS